MAIVCRTCKGRGHYLTRIEYDDFDGLEMEEGVERVFEINLGIGIGKEYRLSEYGGLPYRLWFNNYASQDKPFPPKTENRKYICPAWWYQCVDYDRKPEWDECQGFLSFSNCGYFSVKEKCWERWDRETGKELTLDVCVFERAIDF